MCGIFAIHSRRQPVSPAALASGLEALAHRGPDGRGTWISPSGRVGLGHTRLSIIGLDNGSQPIGSDDGLLQGVVNGEFYGYQAIRQDLRARGHRLRTESDSEIVLPLYRDHGYECLRRLRGEFAFVLWDERRQRLFAARDRFGIKPLYYAEVDGRLLLASEAKALFAAGVPARWDTWSLLQACHVYYGPEQSLFRGVRQVPPGHFLVADEGCVRLEKYWDADLPRESSALPVRSEAEHVERTRAAVTEAIEVRLKADVPVAFYLSGGLDSSAIVGMAQPYLSRPAPAFTISFDAEAYDEGKMAEQTAARFGLAYHPIAVTSDDLADHFHDAIGTSETLNANTNGVAKFLLSRAVRRAGYKVVLTGEGADEVFGGYAFLMRDMLLHELAEGRNPEAGALLATLRGPGLPHGEQSAHHPLLAGVKRELGFVPTFFQAHVEQLAMFEPLLDPGARALHADDNPYDALVRGLDPEQLRGRAPMNQALYLWLRSFFPNFLLNQLADRMEMANSIEGRVPFLDHLLFEAQREVPLPLKIRGLTEKYVLREAARPYVTEAAYLRKKHAFWAPPSGLSARGRLHQMLQDTVRAGVSSGLPLFDRAAVTRFLDRVPALCEEGPNALHGVSAMLSFLASLAALQQRYRPAL